MRVAPALRSAGVQCRNASGHAAGGPAPVFKANATCPPNIARQQAIFNQHLDKVGVENPTYLKKGTSDFVQVSRERISA